MAIPEKNLPIPSDYPGSTGWPPDSGNRHVSGFSPEGTEYRPWGSSQRWLSAQCS
jgi:hypothetical protein